MLLKAVIIYYLTFEKGCISLAFMDSSPLNRPSPWLHRIHSHTIPEAKIKNYGGRTRGLSGETVN